MSPLLGVSEAAGCSEVGYDPQQAALFHVCLVVSSFLGVSGAAEYSWSYNLQPARALHWCLAWGWLVGVRREAGGFGACCDLRQAGTIRQLLAANSSLGGLRPIAWLSQFEAAALAGARHLWCSVGGLRPIA